MGEITIFSGLAQSAGDGNRQLYTNRNPLCRPFGYFTKKRMNLRNNTVRTWIYVRDIDNNYKGMVVARREFFTRIGLTNQTRYIASTGIEGKSIKMQSLVSLDSLSIGNHQRGTDCQDGSTGESFIHNFLRSYV